MIFRWNRGGTKPAVALFAAQMNAKGIARESRSRHLPRIKL